jgi:hypothetical protein
MMSRYDKKKEYDCIEYLEKLGATLITHFGDRHQKSGDFLMSYKDILLRIDHKSTRNDGQLSVRVQKEWMCKLDNENKQFPAIPAIPIITLSFLGWRDYYCLIRTPYVKGRPWHEEFLDPEHWSWNIPTHSLINTPVILLDTEVLIMKIKTLLTMIDEGGVSNESD